MDAYNADHSTTGALLSWRELTNEQLLLGDNANALRSAEAISRDAKATGIPLEIAEADALMGRVCVALQRFDCARVQFRKALTYFESAGDRVGQANLARRSGELERQTGNFDKAREQLEFAAKQFAALGQRRDQAYVLMDIGGVLTTTKRYSEALDYYVSALRLWEDAHLLVPQTRALNAIGNIYEELGEFESALRYYRMDLAITVRLDDAETEAITRRDIGGVLANLERYSEAEGEFQKALKIARDQDDKEDQSAVLNSLAQMYADREQYERALDYYQQDLAVSKATGDQSSVAKTLSDIGDVYCDREMYGQAIRYYREALATLRSAGIPYDNFDLFSGLFKALVQSDRDQEALEVAQEHLQGARVMHDISAKADALDSIGLIEDKQGKVDEALATYRRAIDRIEELRASQTVSSFRLGVPALGATTFAHAIEFATRRMQPKAALEFMERSRARSLMDRIVSGKSLVVSKKIEALRNRLVDLEEGVGRAQEAERVNPSSDAKAVKQASEARDSAYEELATLLDRQTELDVATILRSADEIQKDLDINTTLIEYYVRPKDVAFGTRPVIACVVSNSVECKTLPGSADDLEQYIRNVQSYKSDQALALQRLYDILIRPLEGRLHTPVLAVVPHMALESVPFAALWDGKQYLCDRFAVTTVPSAGLVHILKDRRRLGNRGIVAFEQAWVPGHNALKGAVEEVDRLHNRYGAKVVHHATESDFRQLAPGYRIIHIAAHGVVDLDTPLLSRLLLGSTSGSVSSLDTISIMSLRLNATDMVVLGACRSKDAGIGVMDDPTALDRAFLVAGAASVIASHWDVNDEVASELIEVLYRELDRGVSKVEALRRAQIEVRKKHKKPDDWAAFSLTGDPGEPFSNTATRLRIGINTAIVLLFMGVLTYLLAARIRLQLKMQATADKPLT